MTNKETLPSTVMLPSGRVVGLVGLPDEVPPAAAEATSGPPYRATLSLLEETGAVQIRAEGRPVEPRSLALCDFHALRAILTRRGWLAEAPVTFECRNCKARVTHRACAALELGPFVHRSLNHLELDAMLQTGVPHPLPTLSVGGQQAKQITLAPLTLGEALPLHDALARRRLLVDAAVIRAMGISSVGDERSSERIARALARCSEPAFLAIERVFLDAHYPPRLFSIAKCSSCGARNDVDAPYDREFAPGIDARGPLPGSRASHPYREIRTRAKEREGGPPPTFEAFDARAREVFDELVDENPDRVALIVEGGVPACDEGGEPLLGSYVPPYEGDASSPSRTAEVTVFYQTFLSIWDEDGPYDWDAELRETIEHELEHHDGYRRGHDEVDLEERRAIDTEAMDLIGTRGTAQLMVGTFAHDFAGFLRRTWPLWVLVVAATLAMVAMGR